MPLTRITSSSIADGTVVAADIADGTVTGTKLGITSVSGNNISIRSVSGNNIGTGAISGNQITSGAVSGNQIGLYAISGNQIASGAVSGNQIASGAISNHQITSGAVSGNQIGLGAVSGNQIGLYAISGNNLGIGSISANNFAGGGITSNVLSSNLQLSVSQVTERINISGSSGFYGGTPESTGITGNLNIDVMNSTVHFFEANTTANITFNLRGNSTHQFGQVTSVGNSISMVVRLKHNVSQGRAQVNVHIDGTRCDSFAGTTGNLLLYAGNTIPAYSTISRDEYNMYGLTIFKTSTSSYSVMMSNTIFSRGI